MSRFKVRSTTLERENSSRRALLQAVAVERRDEGWVAHVAGEPLFTMEHLQDLLRAMNLQPEDLEQS